MERNSVHVLPSDLSELIKLIKPGGGQRTRAAMAWCMEACSSLALLAFNGVDLVCGLVLASYGLFLGGSPLSLQVANAQQFVV